uniref:Uncharacterized protein n=1 Tax=Glossina pallidipes TaxID=7398 RepID=A0A1A9Z9P3_GLOPL
MEAATTCCCNARAAAAAAAADEDFFAEDFVGPPPPLGVGKDAFAFVLLPFVMTGTVPVAVAVDAEQGIDGGAAKDAGATASFSLGEFGVLAVVAVPVVVVAVADKLVALAGVLALTDGVIAVVADFDILFPWAVLAAILLVEQELLELVFDSRLLPSPR